MTLLIISFIAGILTVLAPCTFALLPVIIGGSVSEAGNKRRPYLIVGSLAISIVLFTLLLKASTVFIMVPPGFWTAVSAAILTFFAITMIFPSLWEKVSAAFRFSEKSNALLTTGFQKQNVWGDIIMGAALGPVFSSCSPTYFVILATVLPTSFALGVVYLIAYSLGLGLMLLLVAILGQKFIDKMGWAVDPRGIFKRLIGVLFLLVAIFIAFGYDKRVQTYILDQGLFDITRFERFLNDKIEGCVAGVCEAAGGENQELRIENQEETEKLEEVSEIEGKGVDKSKYKNYVEIVNPSGFVNSEPFKLADYVGKKVILLDIMTYSCINCQRTFPYLREWWKKYEDDGLLIVGIHTPEFAFERNIDNVRKAMQEFGLEFPVVLDNDYATWNAYGNRYWPRKYLIDIDGKIVYDHIGEGAYDTTERKIQELLKERKERMGEGNGVETSISNPDNPLGDTNNIKSPETYFGAFRNERLANGKAGTIGEQNFALPTIMYPNLLYLSGKWNITGEYAEALEAGAKIVFKYNAGRVFIVADSDNPVEVKVKIDGEVKGSFVVSESKLYTVTQHAPAEHTLELTAQSKGLRAYAFTFGS